MAALTPRQKLIKAKVRLVDEHPFFGILSTYLSIREDGDVRTAAITETLDTLLYNPDFIDSLDDKQTEFLLAHEVLHIILDHFKRQSDKNELVVTPDGRILPLWNIATDYAVNSILVEEGVGEIPKGGLHDPSFSKKSAEKIYEQLQKRLVKVFVFPSSPASGGNGGRKDGENYDGEEAYMVESGTLDEHPDSSKSSSDSSSSRKTAEGREEWIRRMLSAAQIAKKRGRLPAGLEILIATSTTPSLNWRDYLARFLRSFAKDDYSYHFPDRRFIWQGIHMPDLHIETCELCIAVDTSGSISNEELMQFLTEVAEICATIPSIRLHLICCDAEVQTYRLFEGYEGFDFGDVEIRGGGGTDFRPVFDFIEENSINPDALVFLTDGNGYYPISEPDYPVLWVLSAEGDDTCVPFGETLGLR